MSYVGPIACPDCHCPISDDCSVCPYCYSYAPASAPWKATFISPTWQLILAGALILCVLCDLFLETRILATVASWLPAKD